MTAWVVGVFTPWVLQLNSFTQLVAPHQISENLLTLSAEVEDNEVEINCPLMEMRIAGVYWNIRSTHYSMTATGRICHFVMPQYNVHGFYHIGSSAVVTAHPAASCETEPLSVNYYFYHAGFGYYSFYQEGSGIFCPDDLAATIVVNNLGSYDMNGQTLAHDRGATGYRCSYYFGLIGSIWIAYRALLIRRSFVLFTRHVTRFLEQSESMGLQDVIIYVQETVRLAAHGANNYQRLAIFYLLLEGTMTDLFLFITKDTLPALPVVISLCYNLAGILSILFEMVERSPLLARVVRICKRLFFNHETAFIREALVVTFLQAYITALNRTPRMTESLPIDRAISYYVWGVVGHSVIALTMAGFLLMFRAAGAIAIVWWKYHSFQPLLASCCVEAAINARQKMVLLTGYYWREGRLYYAKRTLRAYGLMIATSESTGDEWLVHEKVRWFVIRRSNMMVLGKVHGRHVDPCDERQCSDPVTACTHVLGGRSSSHTNATTDPSDAWDSEELDTDQS